MNSTPSRKTLAEIALLQQLHLPLRAWKVLSRDEILFLLYNQDSCFRIFEVQDCPYRLQCPKASLLTELQYAYKRKYGTDYWLKDASKADRKYLIDALFTTEPESYLFIETRSFQPARELKKPRRTPLKLQRPYIAPLATGICREIQRILNAHGHYFKIPELQDDDCHELGWSSTIFRRSLQIRIAHIKALIDQLFN